MKTYLKIAWRNLWRNKRRTIITVASISFGVFFSVSMTSVQQGSLENMVENLVKFYSGYIQIQDSSYQDNRSVNHALDFTPSLEKIINSENLITNYTQRIEFFALASSGDKSRGAAIIGIVPEAENEISGLSKWVKDGNYLTSGAHGIMLGKTLAENLDLALNDSLIIYGQGFHGTTAVGIYPISGILDFPLMEMKGCPYASIPR